MKPVFPTHLKSFSTHLIFYHVKLLPVLFRPYIFQCLYLCPCRSAAWKTILPPRQNSLLIFLFYITLLKYYHKTLCSTLAGGAGTQFYLSFCPGVSKHSGWHIVGDNKIKFVLQNKILAYWKYKAWTYPLPLCFVSDWTVNSSCFPAFLSEGLLTTGSSSF